MTTVQAQPKAKPLKPKVSRFVDLMASGKFKTPAEAYEKAGYSPNGAPQAAFKLLKIAEVATAIEARRTSREVQKERKTVADMVECEERLTREMRGETYDQDLVDLEGDLLSLRLSQEIVQKALEENGLSAETRANLANTLATTADSIIATRIQIKTLKLKQHSESNAATVTLMKSKGAFDPRHPPVTDVGAILNATLRNIIDSKWQPPEHLTEWMKNAEDAVFVRAGDVGEARKALTGGTQAKVPPVLFTRKDPKQAAP